MLAQDKKVSLLVETTVLPCAKFLSIVPIPVPAAHPGTADDTIAYQ